VALTGRRLSHYDVIEEISRGGMGVVYRALDVNLAREVALKVLPEDLLNDPGRRARLLQEARAASALEHPNIAVIHEVGEADGGVTFIAMELIRGEKLSDPLARAPLAPVRALTLATEIAEGLARAHDKGIIHRDLKPSNVMVTDDGHAKVIDFGLAKLVETLDDDAATASVHGQRTDRGVVLGTAAYMSPEQARGKAVDRRSDIFSFGVTLYEMVTGRPAFQGQSSLDTMQAVLTQPVPPLPALGGSSVDATADLQRIIAKCTAKEADDRYQGFKDVIVDLRAARRRLESAQTPVAGSGATAIEPIRRVTRSRMAVLGAAALLAAGVFAAFLWRRTPDAPAAAARSGKPAVAVLYFDNNTGDASLDWMRVGLTDMIVTDLSQSVDIEVLGTDRLVQILQQLKRADDRVISAEVIQEVARRAGVDQVVVGSYVRAGGTIRITARLQDARTGRIVSAERVEGAGEASLFALVDELTRRFKSTMATFGGSRTTGLLRSPGAAKPETLDRGLTDITTSSIEAYRHYAEGINFLERGQPLRAIPLLEQAIELDPNFAMAYAKLAVATGNLQMLDRRNTNAKRAIELASRLTTRERYYIQGYFLSTNPETTAQSIEAYQQLLKLHPEHHAARHNLGAQFLALERFQEGVEQYEELLRRGSTNATTHNNHVELLVRSGNVARARELAAEFVRVHPESAVGFLALGVALSADGQFDDARRAFERGEALDPANANILLARRALALLQERWDEADAIGATLARRPSPFVRFASANGTAMSALARGRGAAALADFGRAAELEGLPASFRAIARSRQARLFLQQGQPALALVQAERAVAEAPNTDFEALQFVAVAQAALGRYADAETTVAQMASRAQNLPTERERRRVHWARGEIALGRGDLPGATAELAKAIATLPARGATQPPPSHHSELLLSAAVTHIKAGRDADAAVLLERLQAGQERIFRMDSYVRSIFLRAQVLERRGDPAAARAQYTRFLDFWRGGDLEPGWVAEAEKRVRAR
jgi:TolB-like protein/tetratricopeptide (TPR) repeat protein